MSRNHNPTRTPRWAACLLLVATVSSGLLFSGGALGQDVSEPAILQMFEADWATIENRMVDIFKAGYGAVWLPPPGKADSGGLSVGYDVFDRFDLGQPRDETLYGTETGLKTLIRDADRAGVNIYTDLILNHNGFRDSSTPGFVAAGGYPGFVTTLPDDVDGDFHGRFDEGEIQSRLSGLIDIAQEKNHSFIRHPVDPEDPQNIPSGSLVNLPDPSNARFYPDQDLGGTTVFDPRLNSNVTLYDFNTTDPMQGDAYADNAMGLLMRNIRWMVQEVGVDGFRLDAARHMERWVLDYFDQAVFLAKKQPNLDGSPKHVFSFSETGFDSMGFIQDFIRKDIDDGNLGQVGGNRDALDFIFFNRVKDNLSGNGLVNDWRNVKNASIDANDGYANNGSQGVAFVKSHDETGAYLDNVAHAYMLMRPGNANVYLNAKQFGEERDFPRDGRGDALGGLYGDAVTRLVTIRNTHGRGNYADRTPIADEKEMLIFERERSSLVVMSNRLDSGFDARTIQTSFAAGTPLIELTGNADNPTIDPFDNFPSVLLVNGDGTVNLQVPRNVSNGIEHGSGYLVYGVSGPQGTLRLLDEGGADITTVLAGEDSPTPATNGTARLSDIPVVTTDTMTLRLETSAVILPGSIRDRQADGDQALFKVDGGLDLNDLPGVDNVSQGVAYGFEQFRTTRQPGFFDPSGNGLYEQEIDVTQLSEGTHYVTARAFRHRDPNTFTDGDPLLAGDGGPAVFSDFREAIYVDRLPPESAIDSFEPYGADFQRDLVGISLDKTADSMHIFLNLPAAAFTDDEVLDMAVAGLGKAGEYDRDKWIFGFPAVRYGNNVITIVTFEPTGNSNVQRFSGLLTETQLGLGFGDTNFDGQYSPEDLAGSSTSFETILYSQDTLFNPAADLSGDGLVDNRDLFALGDVLFSAAVDQATWDTYNEVLLRRGDVNQSGTTDAADIDFLAANLGGDQWLFDLNSDGVVDSTDVQTLVDDVFRTLPGDANLDRAVDLTDLHVWNKHKFTSGTGWATGDFNGDGVTDDLDFNLWNANKFQSGGYFPPAPPSVPEPAAGWLGLSSLAWLANVVRTRKGCSRSDSFCWMPCTMPRRPSTSQFC